jgi:hypothetical protein
VTGAIFRRWPVTVTNADGTLYAVHASDAAEVSGPPVVYHPIFSCGMLRRWIRHGWATPREELGADASWWNVCAPLLEDAWNFCAHRREVRGANRHIRESLIADRVSCTARQMADGFTSCQSPPQLVKGIAAIPPDAVQAMIRFGLDAGLRSFHQGVLAALDYLGRDDASMMLEHCASVAGERVSRRDIEQVRLTAMAEGHTSSVVRTAAWCKGRPAPLVFGLNIARDMSDAADELEMNVRDLREWAAADRESAATVYGAGPGRFPWFGQTARVPVVAVGWLEWARELHVVRRREDAGRCRFFLIDEFREGKGALPHLVGRELDDASSDKIWAAIVQKRTAAAGIDWQGGWLEAPDVELNHGDVVAAADGDAVRVAFVGSSARRWRGPVGAWLYEMALASARDDRSAGWKRIYWRKPAAALQAAYDGIRTRFGESTEAGDRRAVQVFEAAQAMDRDRLTPYLSLPAGDAEVRELVAQTRGEIAAVLARAPAKA